MQKVEIYYSMPEAKSGMQCYINAGWRVHTCVSVNGTNVGFTEILVVYEKND